MSRLFEDAQEKFIIDMKRIAINIKLMFVDKGRNFVILTGFVVGGGRLQVKVSAEKMNL